MCSLITNFSTLGVVSDDDGNNRSAGIWKKMSEQNVKEKEQTMK